MVGRTGLLVVRLGTILSNMLANLKFAQARDGQGPIKIESTIAVKKAMPVRKVVY